jgi:hypothetical protein
MKFKMVGAGALSMPSTVHTRGDLPMKPTSFSPDLSCVQAENVWMLLYLFHASIRAFYQQRTCVGRNLALLTNSNCPRRRGPEYGDDNLGYSVTLVGAFADMVVYLPSVEESLISFISEVDRFSRIQT